VLLLTRGLIPMLVAATAISDPVAKFATAWCEGQRLGILFAHVYISIEVLILTLLPKILF